MADNNESINEDINENDTSLYNRGYVNALQDFGNFCTGYCTECPMLDVKGTELTCQEFMAEFPEKFASLMELTAGEQQTYLSEFRKRFKENAMTIEELSTNLCRKLVFGGNTDCQGGDCRACWLEQYEDDVDSDYEE